VARRFEELAVVDPGGRLGTITFARSTGGEPPVLLVTARGFITPAMVRRDLEIAAAFAAEQDGPWWYVVDPTDALPHPANLRHLRSVRKLPGVARYVVVARRRPIRLVSSVLVRLGGPHAVVRSLDEALTP
jgi:hypothetical protein